MAFIQYDQFRNETQRSQTETNGTPEVITLRDNNQPLQIPIEQPPEFSWCSLVTATISMCCCAVLGIIATIIAILSYVDHSTKQYERSKAKRSVVYGLAITAYVIGVITCITIIVVVVQLTNQAVELTDTSIKFSDAGQF